MIKSVIILFFSLFASNGFAWQNYASIIPTKKISEGAYSIRCQGYTSPDIPYMGINDTLISTTSTPAPPWTNATSNNSVSCTLSKVDGRLFLASHSTTAAAPKIVYSDDEGASWTIATISGSTSLTRGIVYKMASGKYIIEGVNGFYSSVNNGATWTFVTNSSINGGHIVKMKNSNVLVITRGLQLKYSIDEGITWINTASFTSTTQKSGTFFIGNRLYSLPYNKNNSVHYTDDGITWIDAGVTTLPNSTGVYVSKTVGGAVYLLRAGSYYKSTDGVNWTSLYSGYSNVLYESLCGDFYYSYVSGTMSVRSITSGALITSFTVPTTVDKTLAVCADENTAVYR